MGKGRKVPTPHNKKKSECIEECRKIGLEEVVMLLGFGNLTPITDEVIASFTKRGCKQKDLEEMRRLGFMYNPQRDSLFAPSLDVDF